ncbi:MAG TPA: DNA polymerase III subunit delta' [Rhabdaerophilum sp.]|nr:DNA polymerase III subunit delta' [Rhabdaerophilum sp.]
MNPIRFLPAPESELPEIDRVPSAPHPREMLSLVGQEAAEREFLDLYNAGRLHHAFMLVGSEGIGKATFAYRVARFLMAEEGDGGGFFGDPAPTETLDIPAEHRATHLIANNAHPDMAVLRRRYDTSSKKFKTEIGVEDMRDALHLLEKTPAFGGWRVVIVDAADDLNTNSANALLKTLEEPPSKTMFLLVCHQPQKMLPTIRSRCRKLVFSPLGESDLHLLAAAISPENRPDAEAIAAAEGSMRQALRHADPALRAYLGAVRAVLDTLPRKAEGEIGRVVAVMRPGAAGEQPMRDFLHELESWLHRGIRQAAETGNLALAIELSEFWSRAVEQAEAVEGYNLDRRAFLMTLLDELATLVSNARR